MTLDDLRVFVAVCDAENLSAVARDLSCSQSAVSQHVKRLERDIGLPLIERRTRGVAPTAAGRVLYDAAVDGLAGLDAALRRLDQLRQGESGTVRITTGGTTLRHFMTEAVSTFRQHFPDVALEFQSATSSRRCLEALQTDRADLAWITIGGPPLRGIEQRPVVDMPWLLVVRNDDPLARRQILRVGELTTIHYISLPTQSTAQRQLTEHLASRGVQMAQATSVADWDTALLLVRLGFGHAIVPRLPTHDALADTALRAIPIDGLPPLTVGWAARRWHSLSPAASEFAATVTNALTSPAQTTVRGRGRRQSGDH